MLAATPLLMVLFSAAGFLLWLRPDLLADLQAWVVGGFPAPVAGVVVPLVEAAVASRGPVLSVGTLAAVWAGTTWIAVVREALAAMWEMPPRPPASLRRILRDLVSLLVLLVALTVSVALTVTTTGGLGLLLDLAGVADGTLSRVFLGGLGILLAWAIAAGVLVWLLGRLPGHRLPLRRVAPVAATGAVLFEVITVVTTVTVGATAGSIGLLGSVLAVLAFLFAGGRVLLSLAAWLATNSHPGRAKAVITVPRQPEPTSDHPEEH